MLTACELPLRASALQVASALWDMPGACLLWDATAGGRSYLAVEPSEWSRAEVPEPNRRPQVQAWGHVPRWVGILPYEAERSRLERSKWSPAERREPPILSKRCWYHYPVVVQIDKHVTVVGEDASQTQKLAARLKERLPRLVRHRWAGPIAAMTDASRLLPASDDSFLRRIRSTPRHREAQLHVERVRAALAYIRAGDIYQVNVARRLEFDARGNALQLLGRLSAQSPSSFAVAWELQPNTSIVSTSPELFVDLKVNGLLRTLPIKGTRARGRDAISDARERRCLAEDPKEAAELAMVIDLERNDIGKVARTGSVKAGPPFIDAHRSVYHRQAWVSGWLRNDVTRAELLRAMMPSGSVTGAPKVRAMEVIADLEEARRGLYTGALGFISQEGGMRLSMAIRTLVTQSGVAHYHVGGGVVADSDPQREFEETGWKAVQVTGDPAGC